MTRARMRMLRSIEIQTKKIKLLLHRRFLSAAKPASTVVWPTRYRRTTSACTVTSITGLPPQPSCTCVRSTGRGPSRRSSVAQAFVSTIFFAIKLPYLRLITHRSSNRWWPSNSRPSRFTLLKGKPHRSKNQSSCSPSRSWLLQRSTPD